MSVINQLLAFLLERGLTVRTGRRHFERALPELLEDAENGCRCACCRLWAVARRMAAIEQSIHDVNHELELIARADFACQRLVEVPSIGPLGATGIIASIPGILPHGWDSRRANIPPEASAPETEQ